MCECTRSVWSSAAELPSVQRAGWCMAAPAHYMSWLATEMHQSANPNSARCEVPGRVQDCLQSHSSYTPSTISLLAPRRVEVVILPANVMHGGSSTSRMRERPVCSAKNQHGRGFQRPQLVAQAHSPLLLTPDALMHIIDDAPVTSGCPGHHLTPFPFHTLLCQPHRARLACATAQRHGALAWQSASPQ